MRNRVTFCISALITLGALFTIGSTSVYADVPDSINYSGILKTAGGVPVADGPYNVTFKIYDVESGLDPALWTETKSVSTVDGLFTTFLGSVTPLPHSVFSAPNRFLGISVEADPEMTPRTAIVAVPYAYRIATVDGATGGTISGNTTIASDLTVNGDVIVSGGVDGGNIELDPSSETSGNILKGGAPFIHNFGTDNTFIGLDAGNLAMSGSSNTASGFRALNSNTTGSYNTASGFYALKSNITGSYNTASGFQALVSNTTGDNNTAVGRHALNYNTTGGNNTASGTAARFRNTTGINNTASGYSALVSNTDGSYNTASGYAALFDNTTGSYNTADGYEALFSNTTGNENTASGLYALVSNTTGDGNTACGASALRFNTTGSGNTATGLSALFYSTGSANTADGDSALIINTAGSGNTASGKKALSSNITGDNNTALGHRANVSTGALINATAIGALAVVSASNSMVLGSSGVFSWGFGVNPAAGHAIEVGTNAFNGNGAYLTTGGAWTNGSDRNTKEGITLVDGSELLQKVNQLRLYSWNYKGENPSHQHVGPMAQDFHAVFGLGDDDKHISTIDPAGVALAAIQELKRQLDAKGTEVEDLREQIAELREMISEKK